MDMLYIPLVGLFCIAAIILLLLISLCLHIRNADSIRIRFLKHSYRSVWLEAPGFCEIQHRNYIYSYSQSADMACGGDKKKRLSCVNESAEEDSTSMGVEGGNLSSPYSSEGFSSPNNRLSLLKSTRPTVSFEDEFLQSYSASREQDDQEAQPVMMSRHLSLPDASDSVRRKLLKQGNQNQQNLSDAADTDADADAELEAIVGITPDEINEIFDTTSNRDSNSRSPLHDSLRQKKVNSVVRDFYRSVRAMKLESADTTNERLQNLANTYSEQ